MTEFQSKLVAAEQFVRDVLDKGASERVIKSVARKVAKATPTIRKSESVAPKKMRA